MRITLLFICSLFTAILPAQFGVTVLYQSSQDNFDYFTVPDEGLLQDSYEIAVDYWFRMPDQRIEFMPTVSYGRYATSILDNFSSSVVEEQVFNDIRATEFGFQFKTNFYLFDFYTGNDSPTWGKRGPALHEGIFIQLAPGLSHYNFDVTRTGDTTFAKSRNRTFFNLGIGAGIDIGISKVFTITPLISYRYNFGKVNFPDLFESCSSCFSRRVESRFSTLQAGIRIGVRLDKRPY